MLVAMVPVYWTAFRSLVDEETMCNRLCDEYKIVPSPVDGVEQDGLQVLVAMLPAYRTAWRSLVDERTMCKRSCDSSDRL